MDEVTAITPLTDIVRVMCVFYSMSRILMKPEDSQMLLGLLLRLLDHANKSVRDAAERFCPVLGHAERKGQGEHSSPVHQDAECAYRTGSCEGGEGCG